MNLKTYIRLALCSITILFSAGCRTTDSQLHEVNKNWDKLIRANHIYPLYPLTQDIQPGDIFLVSSDIDDVSQWDSKGYLKLDHLIARINPTNYTSFYACSFLSGATNEGATNIPNCWLKGNSWTNAPTVAFPSYSFTVQEGAGFNVALPIQGIPVGLGLMQTKRASGFVTIGDSYTYGVDELSLESQVRTLITNHITEIENMLPESTGSATNYLQVVTRVYLTATVTVSMFNDSATGTSAWAGAPKELNVPILDQTNAAMNYTNLVNAINSTVRSSNLPSSTMGILPGGTLKFSLVSSRAVTMSETFAKPIAIGYLGFTIPIVTSINKSAVGPGAQTDFLIGHAQTIEMTLRALNPKLQH